MHTKVEPPSAGGRSWTQRFPGKGGESKWEWSHFDLVHAQAKLDIDANPELPVFARHLLTGTDESPRIVTDGKVVAGVLPAYARTGDADAFELTYWHFAMTPQYLVTGRRRATRTLVNIWESVRNGLDPIDPPNLIDLCIAEFAREVRGRLAVLAADLDPVEDLLIERQDAARLTDLGGRLGAVRREASRLQANSHAARACVGRRRR